jgi:hypothetical protein
MGSPGILSFLNHSRGYIGRCRTRSPGSPARSSEPPSWRSRCICSNTADCSLCVGDGEARADCQCGELIDRIAAGAPVRKLVFVEVLGHTRLPFARFRPDHRAGIELAEAWTDAIYTELRQSIERVLPEGRRRSDALKRVAILDCGLKGDIFASCDPLAEPPDAVNEWKEIIRAASIDVRAYNKALAAILGDLVCSNEPYSFDVLTGLLLNGRVRSTGDEAPALVKRITSRECPVSKTFTASYKRAITDLGEEVQRGPAIPGGLEAGDTPPSPAQGEQPRR